MRPALAKTRPRRELTEVEMNMGETDVRSRRRASPWESHTP